MGQTAKQWLPLARKVDLPVAFLTSPDGRIHWFGDPEHAPNFQDWIGSAAEKRFWRRVAEQERVRKEWAKHPLKQGVDRISKLIDADKFDEARHLIDVFQKAPKSDQLDPAKFAPFLRLCVAEHERKVHEFYVAAREIATLHETDAPMLNQVAWKIVDPHSRIPRRDWALAVSLAQQASSRSPTNPAFYDTLGWALYGNRQTQAAMRAERRALWFSRNADDADRCQSALNLFRKTPR